MYLPFTWTIIPASSFSIPLKAKGRLVLPYKPSYNDTAYQKPSSMTMHRNLPAVSLHNYAPTNRSNNHPPHRMTTTKTRLKNTSTSLPPWLDVSYSSLASIQTPIGSTPFNTPPRSKSAVPWLADALPMNSRLEKGQMSVTYASSAVKPWRTWKRANARS